MCVAGRAPLSAIENYPGSHETGKVPLVSQTTFCEGLAIGRPVRGIDRIVVAMEERRGQLPVDLLLSLKNRGVQVQDGNDVCTSP